MSKSQSFLVNIIMRWMLLLQGLKIPRVPPALFSSRVLRLIFWGQQNSIDPSTLLFLEVFLPLWVLKSLCDMKATIYSCYQVIRLLLTLSVRDCRIAILNCTLLTLCSINLIYVLLNFKLAPIIYTYFDE